MKGIILYQSKYGATKKYAQWLVEKTGFDCENTKEAKIENVKKYDVIVLGGGIYASGIAGLSFLKKNIQSLQNKKIIVFFDGASPYDSESFKQVVAHNMKDDLANIPCFYCRGAWDMDAMTFVDRKLCQMLIKSVQKKNPEDLAVWEKALLEAGNQKMDWTDPQYLQPILDEINS